mgnify:CR=1 FL=1
MSNATSFSNVPPVPLPSGGLLPVAGAIAPQASPPTQHRTVSAQRFYTPPGSNRGGTQLVGAVPGCAMRSRIGGGTLRYGQCGGYRLRGGRSGHEHSGRLTGPRAERTRPQMCARRRRSARRWAGCASWRGKRGRLTLRGNQRSAWQYRRQSATAGAANLGWCAIAGMRSLEKRKSAIGGSASVHSCAIAGAKRGRRRYGAMERTAGFDGTAQGHPHYRGRTDGTWSCAGQSESAGASRFNRRTPCRRNGSFS